MNKNQWYRVTFNNGKNVVVIAESEENAKDMIVSDWQDKISEIVACGNGYHDKKQNEQ